MAVPGVALVTGGAGFFGSILARRLSAEGWRVVTTDLHGWPDGYPVGPHDRGDLRDPRFLDELFARHRFDVIFHCAAQLAHGRVSRADVWSCNVDATRSLADHAERQGVAKVIFTSSNCLWCRPTTEPISEAEPPCPCEEYGLSKLAGEQLLLARAERFETVVIRCPTIIDEGRLGLLAMLFEFIDESRTVWLVGGGRNRYQFIYAQDLATACISASGHQGSAVLHIGSDDVKPMAEVFQYVIDAAGSQSRLVGVPKRIAIPSLRFAHSLGLSPLGPYQYRMIAEDFLFDTAAIKRVLGWRPTLTNEQMLHKAYVYYRDHRAEIVAREAVSAHRKPAPMGIIRLLKWMS